MRFPELCSIEDNFHSYWWTICLPLGCLSEDNIPLRKAHVNNFKYEDELEFFIQLPNKTALKEIDARDTVTSENPPLDLPKEEEVANDVI